MASFGKTAIQCYGPRRQHDRSRVRSSCLRRGPLTPACAQPRLGRHYAVCARAESASPAVHPMKKALILSMLVLAATANAQSIRLAFEGTQAIHKLLLKDLGPDFASDWSAFEYLVLEIRTSTP